MTSKPSTTSHSQPTRPSTSQPPSLSKPPCTIHPSALIADRVQITGTHHVEVGEDVIIHPYAKIRAEHGSVTIGRGTIIWERAEIGCAEGCATGRCEIGEYVTIESSALVQGERVGEGTVVDVGAVVEAGVVVGKWCKIAALERVKSGEKEVEDFTVVFGEGRRKVDGSVQKLEEVREGKREAQVKTIAVLRGLLVDGKGKWI